MSFGGAFCDAMSVRFALPIPPARRMACPPKMWSCRSHRAGRARITAPSLGTWLQFCEAVQKSPSGNLTGRVRCLPAYVHRFPKVHPPHLIRPA
jgi:hypothetical protein